ncbi:FAD-dependent thymidylate synthase [Paenibacillus apiarius]|uniref:FAD-dependent thymidylate synthase n=1 Tax=Paenibacillus apiarius TaxID=46240 RepID=UPI003B3AF8A6
MNVKLIAHTQLSDEFLSRFDYEKDVGTSRQMRNPYIEDGRNQRAALALTAIRTCYSPLKPTEIVAKEGEKYFGQSATDGEGGTEADRLIRHIIASKHTSTLEHVTYTFAIEGVSRSLLAQLTRHRVGFSYSVQSQRYVRFGSEDKSGGFEYVTPPSVESAPKMVGYFDEDTSAAAIYYDVMRQAQTAYDGLRACGVPAEDARMVLPNAAACNLVMTVNLRALLDFYAKRKRGNGAQWEIADLAERLREEVVKVDPWTAKFFE